MECFFCKSQVRWNNDCDKCDTWYEVFHDKKILVDQKKRHPE